MLVCTNCNNTQESGQFCGVCGGQLVEQGQAQQETNNQPQFQQQPQAQAAQPNQTAENVKQGLSHYGNYLLDLLKQPTKGLNTGDKNFVNGLITLVIYSITFALSVYFLINGLYKELTSWWGTEESAPFFEITSRLTLYVTLLVAAGLVSAFAMSKAAKANIDFKTLIAQYGSLAVPFVAINVLANLTALASSEKFTLILLLGGYLLFVFVTPALLVFEKATQVDANGQRFYLSIGTAVLTAIIIYFVFDVVVSGYLDDIERTYGLF